MHSALLLATFLLLVLSGLGTLGMQRHLRDWPRRRVVQGAVLFAPVVNLLLIGVAVYHFANRRCLLEAPRWDQRFPLALILGMGLLAFGGVALGLLRLALVSAVVRRSGIPAGPELVAVAARLAARLDLPSPRVLLCAYDRPLAMTHGLWRPTVLVSSWLIEHLDTREVEAVLAHELAHIARRDYLAVWLATVLRDAFAYLPASWAAYYHLRHDNEQACDDLAVGVTARPLALASALTKVWQPVLSTPYPGTAQSLLGVNEAIEGRIARLLRGRGPEFAAHTKETRVTYPGIGVVATPAVAALAATNVLAMFALLGCGPAAPLVRMFG